MYEQYLDFKMPCFEKMMRSFGIICFCFFAKLYLVLRAAASATDSRKDAASQNAQAAGGRGKPVWRVARKAGGSRTRNSMVR